MSGHIEEVKTTIRAFLCDHCDPVFPKAQGSQQKHLEVWTTRKGSRAIGLEFGHADIVNLWVTSMNVPSPLPANVTVVRKTPKGSKWTDAKGDGANSNLSGYEEFRTKPIARLGLIDAADAILILEHLIR
jgi:hypothetical protein